MLQSHRLAALHKLRDNGTKAHMGSRGNHGLRTRIVLLFASHRDCLLSGSRFLFYNMYPFHAAMYEICPLAFPYLYHLLFCFLPSTVYFTTSPCAISRCFVRGNLRSLTTLEPVQHRISLVSECVLYCKDTLDHNYLVMERSACRDSRQRRGLRKHGKY